MKVLKPINGILKSRFNELYNQAIANAEIDFRDRVEKNLIGKDLFNQVKFLLEELAEVERKISESAYPFYIKNHSSEDWLLNQFASRTFLLNVDEADEVAESITLGTLQSLIFDKKREIKKLIPKYTYEAFLAGVIEPYFARLENFTTVEEDDYYKIRAWQSDALIKVISYESGMIIRQIQQHVKTLENPLDFILKEKEKIETALENASLDSNQIKAALRQFFLFSDLDFSQFDDTYLVENYQGYKSSRMQWAFIFPFYLNPILKKVEDRADQIFSNEVTIFFTINKVSEWYEAVLSGQPIQNPVLEIDWTESLNTIEEKAFHLAEVAYQEVLDFVKDRRKTKKEVKDFLLDQLEVYRTKFNDFEDKHLFAFLYEERRHLFERQFITNSFFANDLEGQSKLLQEVILIHEMCWKLVTLYGETFNGRMFTKDNDGSAHVEIMGLMHKMVMDKEIYERMSKISNDFLIQFHSTCLPIEIHFQNHKVLMQELFQISLKRLQSHLDDAEPSNKILFMQSRLKELRHRELEIKQLETERYFRKGDFMFTGLFKEFLEIEAQFIAETKDLEFLTPIGGGKKPLAISGPPQTLSSLMSEKNEVFFLKMLEDMSITINGKSNLSERRKGVIRGIVEASIEKNILPQMSLDSLCRLVADKIGLELKAKLDYSDTSEKNKKAALRYISERL